MRENKLKWLLESRAYLHAQKLVGETIRSPQKLLDLVTNAQSKASNNNSGRLSIVIDPVADAFRLLRSYASGEYREISFESLALITASIIYFVMPMDVIPDFILALGFADDAALLAWTFRSVADDIQRFLNWESLQQTPDQRTILH